MAVTTLLQRGLYSIGCLDILSSVADCVSLPLSKAGHLVQQCLCLSMIIDLFFLFSFWYENINISNTSRRGGWTGLGTAKVGCFPLISSYPTFLPPGHVVPDCRHEPVRRRPVLCHDQSRLHLFVGNNKIL